MNRTFVGLLTWVDRVDPGAHRRIKGLRLITAYGIAAMLGTMGDITRGVPGNTSLAMLAGGFALWASVSEARQTRFESTRDLLVLVVAAGIGATIFALSSPLFASLGHHGPELFLATGAFCAGYLRRFGVTGAGVGSQIFIGQLLAYGGKLKTDDFPEIAIAVAIAGGAATVQRILSGPAERPPPSPPALGRNLGTIPPELALGLQAATGALIIVLLNQQFDLVESGWAITACTYVIAGSLNVTTQRVIRRIVGTAIGVPLGLALLPFLDKAPVLAWAAAALAMVVYAMALPERYDIACGAYAFTLIVTLSVTGDHTVSVLDARIWETLLGAGIGYIAAKRVFPLKG